MILMWLGSLVLMLFGLVEAQKQLAELFLRFQKTNYDRNSEHSLKQTLIQSVLLVLLEASPQKSLYTALALYNLRITRLRSTVLTMCLSPLGLWWVLLIASLYLNFNGFFLLGLCTLGWFSYSLTGKFERSIKIVFAVGLFLVGGETALRNSTVIQTLLGQSELAFFLADGRFVAVLTIALAAFLTGLFMRFENWALVLSLALLTTSTVSFNGALGLFVGAKLAEIAVVWWRSRILNQDCQRLGRQYTWVSAMAFLIGFVFAGEFRTAMNWGFTTELSAFQEKSLQFLGCILAIHLIQALLLLAWGHLAGNVKVDELQDARYFGASWLKADLLSGAGRTWAKDRVHKRLSEIRYHLAGLSSLKEGQVPEHVQSRLKEEEQQLSQIVL